MVSAAGFEPATHALKEAPTYSQTTTCTSSLLHARFKRIKQIRAGQSSGCPEGAQDPTLRLNHSGSRGIAERLFNIEISRTSASIRQRSVETNPGILLTR